MKTTTNSKQSLLTNAFGVLLKNFGPRKTTELWQILAVPKIDYLKIRQKLFAGKSTASLYKEIGKFNRK